MKFKLMKLDTPAYQPDKPAEWNQAVRCLFNAPDAATAEQMARRQILWLKPADQLRMDLASGVSLGAQLWEPCCKCGAEPSYAQPGGHLCSKCAQTDHPRIVVGRVLYHSEEPDGAS